MENILVTAIGSFSADIVIKKLKAAGYRIIGTDYHPKPWIVDAYQVDSFYQVPMVDKSNQYLNTIVDICVKEKVKYIIPLTDLEIDIFDNYRSLFQELSICLCISSAETIRICRDKILFQDFVQKLNTGINSIPTVYAKDASYPPFDYPMIAKPNNGRSSQGIFIISDAIDWDYFQKKISTPQYIIQPYLSGEIITLDIIKGVNNRNIVVIPRKELIRTGNGAGLSVRVFSDSKLQFKCKKIAEALNIRGCVNFELIHDSSDHYYILECNPRFSGGVEFSCIAGYDCVINHLMSFIGEEIDEFSASKSLYISRKYEEYITESI